MKPRKRIKRYAVYLLVRTLVAGLYVLPVPWVRALGRLGGRVYGAFSPLLQIAQDNLRRALGISEAESKELAAACFAHVGQVGAEMAVIPRVVGEIDVSGARQVLQAALSGGQGALFVTGHIGNWEQLAHAVARDGFPCATVARRMSNPWIGTWLEGRREAVGLKTIHRQDAGALKAMLKTLRQGSLLGILVDQDTRVDNIHAPFFGRPAATPSIAASLADRGIPLVFGHLDGNRLVAERLEPGPTKEATTARINQKLEAAIRTAPARWVWFHERWKTPPPTA